MKPVRKEINTRLKFSKEQGEYWFKQMNNVQRSGGNILSSRATRKFLQAIRIDQHYKKEFRKLID